MEHIQLKWKCGLCGDEKISYSNKKWDMDMCKCGKTGVDLEEWYQRNIGKVIELERKEIENTK